MDPKSHFKKSKCDPNMFTSYPLICIHIYYWLYYISPCEKNVGSNRPIRIVPNIYLSHSCYNTWLFGTICPTSDECLHIESYLCCNICILICVITWIVMILLSEIGEKECSYHTLKSYKYRRAYLIFHAPVIASPIRNKFSIRLWWNH